MLRKIKAYISILKLFSNCIRLYCILIYSMIVVIVNGADNVSSVTQALFTHQINLISFILHFVSISVKNK